MTPVDSIRWIDEVMTRYFPLGVFRDRTAEAKPMPLPKISYDLDSLLEKLEIPSGEAEGVIASPVPHPRYANPRIKIAGFGGQGILLLGQALAEAGMTAGYRVSWLPSYGPEMRGGTANCHVILSDSRIGSPLVSRPSVLIAMNRPSLDRFEPEVESGGLILYDSSLIDRPVTRRDVEVLAIPATSMADELGNTRAANMVILGSYVAYTGVVEREHLTHILPKVIKRKQLIDLNERAIARGYEYALMHRTAAST
jgi:Pyruvate/2-oxoacid:ferredoxin oxidoreductase gamma subunit